METKRIEWLDGMKGILILLVVLGHVIGGAHHLTCGLLSITLNKVFLSIYMFHMPAFFLLAGWLAGRSVTSGDRTVWQRVVRKVRRLLVPYYVFGVASVLLYWLVASYGTVTLDSIRVERGCLAEGWNALSSFASIAYGANLPGTDAFRCNGVLWFLPCLFSVQMLDLAITRCLPRRNRAIDLCLSVVSLLTAAVFHSVSMPSLPYALDRVPWFYAYFSIGRCLPQSMPDISNLCKVIVWPVLPLLTVAYFIICLAYPCYDRQEPNFFLQVRVLFLALFGTGLTGCFAQMFSCRWLTSLGRASIGIMLTHKFAVMALQFGCSPIKALFARGVFSCVVGIVLVTLVSLAFGHVVTLAVRALFPLALGEGLGAASLLTSGQRR